MATRRAAAWAAALAAMACVGLTVGWDALAVGLLGGIALCLATARRADDDEAVEMTWEVP